MRRVLNILHVTPTYLPAVRYGGPIRSVHGLCAALAARGHRVDVFTTNVDGDGDSDVPLDTPVEIDGVRVFYFPSTHLRRLYWSPRMRKALKARVRQYDLVHAHALYLWPTWAASRAARAASVPYVLAPRGMLIGHLIARKSRMLKLAWIRLVDSVNIRHAAALQMTTDLEAEEARRFNITLPRLVVVPNGVDIPAVLRPPMRPGTEEKPYRLLFLSRINWKKGLDRLVPALRFVPDARLTISGNDEEDYTREVERIAKEAGVLDRIEFTGPVEGERKAKLLREAALFVLPSYSENFGIVVIEAMAAECPVVVTPEVGVAPEVAASGAGIVTDGEPRALGKAIAALLADPQRRAEMGRRGLEAVRAQYGWAAIARDMEAIYGEILGRAPQAAPSPVPVS